MTERRIRVDFLLRENIRALLVARHMDDRTLAELCGHKRAWISKILNGDRGVQMIDLGKIAGAFGLSVSQLFSYGISPLTERRHRTRRQRERRLTLGRRAVDLIDNVENGQTERSLKTIGKNIVVETNYPPRLQLGSSTDELGGAGNAVSNPGGPGVVTVSGEGLPATLADTDRELERVIQYSATLTAHRSALVAAGETPPTRERGSAGAAHRGAVSHHAPGKRRQPKDR